MSAFTPHELTSSDRAACPNSAICAGPGLSPRGADLVSWDQRFFDPIIIPGPKPRVTLRDAAHYITKLPKVEHDAEANRHGSAASLVAEHDGPTMFARFGVSRWRYRSRATSALARSYNLVR
jgi:hypothetical protein